MRFKLTDISGSLAWKKYFTDNGGNLFRLTDPGKPSIVYSFKTKKFTLFIEENNKKKKIKEAFTFEDVLSDIPEPKPTLGCWQDFIAIIRKIEKNNETI